MARTELDRAVLPSLLDRLTDEDPRTTSDVAVAREESVRRFRQALQRDVEALLNTRRCIVEISPADVELRRSVHEYGIPDTTGLAVGTTAGRQLLTNDIKDALQRFEPRLMNVSVRLTDSDQARASRVRFAIEATLRMDPSPEQIVFDTVLEIASGSYAVDENG